VFFVDNAKTLEHMKDKRVLYVSSEVVPYLPETEISSMSFEAPRMVNKQGGQIRIFMPRYGNINERRHQLHEVIRLSGINLVINDLDMPLIIKVASIPKERIQVYFIDNEEYFKRKATFTDENGTLFEDNDERAIFFAKGVIETVKKLNWAPDIIHVHGWLASLLPLYLKQYYRDEPLFKESKIVTSIYNQSFDDTLNTGMIDKIKFDEIEDTHINKLKTPSYSNLMKVAVDFSDGLIKGSQELPKELEDYIDNCDKPVLDFQYPEAFAEAYTEFYNTQILKLAP
jgi:starch synthase